MSRILALLALSSAIGLSAAPQQKDPPAKDAPAKVVVQPKLLKEGLTPIAPAGPQLGGVADIDPASLQAASKLVPLAPAEQKRRVRDALALQPAVPDSKITTTARVTPRTLYVNATTGASASRATIYTGAEPAGVIRVYGADYASWATGSSVSVGFRAAANTSYLLDCAIGIDRGVPVTYETTVDSVPGPSGSSVAELDHVMIPVPARPTNVQVAVQMKSAKSFDWTGCEIIAVAR